MTDRGTRTGSFLPGLGRRVLQDFSILIVFLLVLVGLSVLSPRFLNTTNITNVIEQVSMIGIIAMGMTLLLISGNFDLSVGGIVALISVATAQAINSDGIVIGMVLAIVLGTLCGLVNALIVTRLRVNSLVATLGTGLTYSGLAYIVSGSQPITLSDPSLQAASNSHVLGIPVPVLCFVAVVVLTTWFLHFTIGGREFFAVGANATAARYAGLRIERVQVLGFVVTGALCAVSALIFVGLLNSGQPDAATSWPLQVIAAVVVGGVSILGGRGSTYMAVVGVLLIGTLNNGFNLLNLDPNLYSVFTGLIIVAAVALDGLLQRSARATVSSAEAEPSAGLDSVQIPMGDMPDGREGGGT